MRRSCKQVFMTLLLLFGALRAIFLSKAVSTDDKEPDLREIQDAESSEILNGDYLRYMRTYYLLLNLP